MWITHCLDQLLKHHPKVLRARRVDCAFTFKLFRYLPCKMLQEAFSLWTRHREQHFCERCKQNDLTLSKDLKLNVPNKVVVLTHSLVQSSLFPLNPS